MSTPVKRRKVNSTLLQWVTKPNTEADNDLIVGPTCSATSPVSAKKSSHRQSGVDPSWKKTFPWVLFTDNENGMLCSFCTKFNMKSKNGSGVWVSVPCTYLVRDSLLRHAKTKMHIEATDLEANSILAGKGQSIQSAVEHHTSLEKTALIGAFKIMYWLAKEEIPHTTHFASLLDLAKNLGCDYLNLLQKGESVNYTSQRIMQEMLHSISLQISTPVIDAIQQSTYYSLLVDETTDVSVLKQLTVMARYFNQDLELKTSFLTLIDVPDGKADTLVAALKQFMTENQLPAHSFIGLGSDGAAVMVGKKTGVATQLKADLNSELINIHCIAHRLALAAAQASNNIPYLQKFKSILKQLFYYYQNSAVRMSGLKQLEHILGDPAIKLKEVGDTRWLSHETAVRAVSQCLPSLIASLEREASERHDATAAGLATFVKSPSFVCTLAMLGDVLPHLNRLSKLFQKTSVDFTLVDPLVSSTQMTLLRLLEYPADHMTNLPTRFEQLEEYGVKGSETDITSFKERIYHQYINNVVENLHQRFPDTNILDALSVFDPELIDKEDPSLHEWLQHQKLKTLSDHFTSVGTFEMVKTEFHSLRQLIAVNMKDHSLRDAMLKVIQMGDMYPALAKYCMIALVLPVSTADCERSFSTMARIKSVLRNRLSQRVLNQLMCISIEGPSSSDFNFPSCVSAFGQIRKRKLTTD
ncbi:zinc finger protein 862-like [Mytilus galloprovincialis]|uniref:zinc finger protein 862-like n=1 Tax=Mytilus galloprovincialis TaxID=29158 RepID=UPI003F7C6596